MIKINKKKFVSWREVDKQKMKSPEYRKLCMTLKPKFDLIRALVDARNEDKITQKELAKRLKTHQSAIARFESGTYSPSLTFTSKVATALGRKLKVA